MDGGYRSIYGRRLQIYLWTAVTAVTDLFMDGGYGGYRSIFGRRLRRLQIYFWTGGL